VAKKSVRIFFLLSLLFFSLDIIFILLNYHSAKKSLNVQFNGISKEVESAFIQARQATELRMLQLATLVAGEPSVQQLFLAGKKAVIAEGGGAGGAKTAAIRKKLFNLLAASRDAPAAGYDFLRLHFYLGPNSLSFLRLDAPEKFGDRVDSVRHMLVDVNHTHRPVAGFETGRVYSGIRGVVPVFASNRKTKKKNFIGAIEAGTPCHSTLEDATRSRPLGMAVLLTIDHIKNTVPPAFLQKFLQRNPPRFNLIPESTTGPEIDSILKKGLLPKDLRKLTRQVADLSGIPHLIVCFPLFDFAYKQNNTLPPVGAVIGWQNISAAMEGFENGLKINILYGIFAFVLAELLLYYGIHSRAKKLEDLVEQEQLGLTRSLEQLRASEEKFETMAEFSVDWDAWHGLDGRSIYITPSCEEMSGYAREVFYEDPEFIVSIVHPDDQDKFCEHRRQHYVQPTGQAEVTFRIICKDGKIRWIWHKCQAVFSADGTWRGRRTTNRDVTELKKTEMQLQRLSTTDVLTGAYNRRMFMDLLTREMKRVIRYGEPFSLLMFDVDNFKSVNDTYGHDTGDRVLIEIVRLSMETIRQADVLARWGGEEFMVLLPETRHDMARTLGERLRKRIDEHSFEDIGRLTVSVGVTSLQQVDTIDSLLKRVDEALYNAKESGRNRVAVG
jgi:diguanylate cyclase (GGDEF)-like protein/PAS domain S-box-containing protein